MDIKTNEFEFTPKRCEQLDACIKVPCDPRGVITGRILDCCNNPIKDATLKLFERTCKDELCPITHTFTDESGFFLFGPLCPCSTYVIKVFVDNVKSRVINIDKCKCAREMDCLECDHSFCDGMNKKDCCNKDDDDCDFDDDYDDFECKCRRKHSCKENKGCGCKQNRCDCRRESRNKRCRRGCNDF